ncbi:penicillin-insensitive murein endopeptidase [Methylomonas sp. MgM2]
MQTTNKTRLILFSLVAAALSSKSHANDNAAGWSHFAAPTIGSTAESVGTYSNGCISGAVALPLSGTGYQVMRISRNRFYGHPSLIRFIRQLGQDAVEEGLGTLLIGDLGQPRGGPTPSGHRSHQTGLDADIWFLVLDERNNRLLSQNERENWTAPSMLDATTENLDYHRWTRAQKRILQIAASNPDVDRIFVNPTIKRDLCKRRDAASKVWLRKIRPWWKHDDHFHVRLKCPDRSPHCLMQDPAPEGDGCDASLEWWFSAEAKITSAAKPSKPPKLPALCERIFNQ